MPICLFRHKPINQPATYKRAYHSRSRICCVDDPYLLEFTQINWVVQIPLQM
jgi:hypothetical protein